MGKQMGVAVAGCGVVGSGLAEMLTKNREVISRAAGADIFLKYMVDVREIETPEGVTLTSDFSRVLDDPDIKVVAETIGGARIAYDYTKRALEKGISVITSNKELVATHGDTLKALARAHGAKYLYEASVCGGVPVLRPIGACLAGNRITSLSGIVNGSTNYLLTRMEQSGMGFPAALGEAKSMGYVEANPDADIEGWDARRKLAILANAAFASALTDDVLIPTEGIARVTERDMACAKALHGAVKLIVHGEMVGAGWTGWVHPALVTQESPLYGVNDVFNALVVTGDCVGDVLFYGRGAGKLPTASALVGDLIEIARGAAKEPGAPCFGAAPAFVSPDDTAVTLAVRVEGEAPQDIPGIAKTVQLDGMSAVQLEPMRYSRAMATISAIERAGLKVGIPLIVF